MKVVVTAGASEIALLERTGAHLKDFSASFACPRNLQLLVIEKALHAITITITITITKGEQGKI